MSAWHLPYSIVGAIAELGRAQRGNRSPAQGAGRLLWVVHSFASVVEEQPESRQMQMRDVAAALQADPDQVSSGIDSARVEFAKIERFCK